MDGINLSGIDKYLKWVIVIVIAIIFGLGFWFGRLNGRVYECERMAKEQKAFLDSITNRRNQIKDSLYIEYRKQQMWKEYEH